MNFFLYITRYNDGSTTFSSLTVKGATVRCRYFQSCMVALPLVAASPQRPAAQITTDGDFKVHTFNSSGTFQVTAAGAVLWNIVLCGRWFRWFVFYGGGGGAGGYRTATNFSVSAQSYSITVGAGVQQRVPAGLVINKEMMDQIVFLAASHQLVVVAGGVRGQRIPRSALKTVDRGVVAAGLADFAQEVATLTPEAQAHQDRVMTVVIVPNNNGDSGGGGGSGSAGQDSPGASTCGAGGSGTASSITGSSVTRAGGGGGGGPSAGIAGSGGGGTGAQDFGANPGTGSVNTGSGGGGAGNDQQGGAGGSGVVIIRYQFQ